MFQNIIMISQEAEDELLVVASVYCVGGEFHKLDEEKVREGVNVKFSKMMEFSTNLFLNPLPF